MFFINDAFSFLVHVLLVSIHHFPGISGQSTILDHLQDRWWVQERFSLLKATVRSSLFHHFILNIFIHKVSFAYHSVNISRLSWDFLKKILFIHDRHTERGRDIGRGKKQAPCGEPDMGLDPRIPGSWPEPKADAQPLSHPGAPILRFLWERQLWRFYAVLISLG